MKKAFDQTVRDLKREVNKKVLKVPGIEQKILDATSNEPWGPHGSHLAEIAQATRNYHEYQLIMSIIWKRINDTGKNWRHVYKGLTVLEYLVGYGSERVIDEIREHAYQISTLSDFQYIDSSGRDQGNNVRKKSQSLVALVNDKERIQEVRQKALANKDKYRSTFSTSGSYRPGSYSSTGGGLGDRYDDDRYEGRYGSRDDSQYGRERDGGYRDDDRYGRGGDSYSRDGDRHGRDPDRYGRDSYRDDDYRGRGRNDDYEFGSRSRSVDRDRGRSFDDEDRYSSRSGGGRVDDSSHDERNPGHKLPEQTAGAPPIYEEAIKDARSPVHGESDGKPSAVTTDSIPKAVSPPNKVSSPETTTISAAAVATSTSSQNKDVDAFDEFDPRGSASAAPPAANSVEMDLFGSLSAEDSINSLALVPVTSAPTTTESDIPSHSGSTNNFVALSSASSVLDQPCEDPFGDAPFKAIPQYNFSAHPQNNAAASFQPTSGSVNGFEPPPPVVPKVETGSGFDFGESFHGITYTPSSVPNGQLHSATQALPAVRSSGDLLENLLPQTGPASAFPSQAGQPMPPARSQTAPPEFLGQTAPPMTPHAVPNQFAQPGLSSQAAPPNPFAQSGLSSQMAPPNQFASVPPNQFAAVPQNQFASPSVPAQVAPLNLSQSGLSAPLASQSAISTTSVPQTKASKDKFETKSTVWADTLSRGLVNLNISGPKTNPLADIGVDFDSINRKEKLKEKEKSSASTMSTITMGKAMGSGSGIGRSGGTGLAPPPNSMMGSGMGMGMGAYAAGMNQNMGVGMAGYAGGMNRPVGMGMGMGMNMGMGQGAAMRPGYGMPPGPGMPGVGYNPMGMGGYGMGGYNPR